MNGQSTASWPLDTDGKPPFRAGITLGLDTVIDAQGLVLAIIVSGSRDAESRQALARLFSAAPDMLEALEGLMEAFTEDYSSNEYADEYIAAANAIAVARGELP